MSKKIFIASPISGFSDETAYLKYRKTVIGFIEFLRKSSFYVYSEIERVTGKDNYDSPEESVNEDFKKIDNSDIFVLLHPRKIQTSTFIELGYAYALNKSIIIISQPSILPYLALGLKSARANVRIIETSELNTEVFEHVITLISD